MLLKNIDQVAAELRLKNIRQDEARRLGFKPHGTGGRRQPVEKFEQLPPVGFVGTKRNDVKDTQHRIEDDPDPDAAGAKGPAYRRIEIPKERQRGKILVQRQRGFIRKIGGDANEARFFLVDEFSMFMERSERRLPHRITSALIKTQHDVAAGERLKDRFMRALSTPWRQISALNMLFSGQMDVAEECLAWEGCWDVRQHDGQVLHKATATGAADYRHWRTGTTTSSRLRHRGAMRRCA